VVSSKEVSKLPETVGGVTTGGVTTGGVTTGGVTTGGVTTGGVTTGAETTAVGGASASPPPQALNTKQVAKAAAENLTGFVRWLIADLSRLVRRRNRRVEIRGARMHALRLCLPLLALACSCHVGQNKALIEIYENAFKIEYGVARRLAMACCLSVSLSVMAHRCVGRRSVGAKVLPTVFVRVSLVPRSKPCHR
jgi:hypothetical protein